MDSREKIAEDFDQAAVELEKAAAYYRIAATRYRAQDVSAGWAHAFAGIGHVSKADVLISKNAEMHSNFARIIEQAREREEG
jgi:hypothetical protein